MAAAKAADRLFDLLPPLDVGDPQAFIAATVAIFADYPLSVMRDAIQMIVRRTSRPTLDVISKACDEIYEPIRWREEYRQRELERARQPVLLPRAARTPEQQAAIDAQVASARKSLGILVDGLPRRDVKLPPSADAPYSSGVSNEHNDGKHALRVQADLDKKRRPAE